MVFEPAASLSPRTHLEIDVQTGAAGTSQAVALQVNDAWTWCQGPWGWQNADTTATVDVDLTALDCGITDLSRVKALWIWFSGGGIFHLAHVRVE